MTCNRPSRAGLRSLCFASLSLSSLILCGGEPARYVPAHHLRAVVDINFIQDTVKQWDGVYYRGTYEEDPIDLDCRVHLLDTSFELAREIDFLGGDSIAVAGIKGLAKLQVERKYPAAGVFDIALPLNLSSAQWKLAGSVRFVAFPLPFVRNAPIESYFANPIRLQDSVELRLPPRSHESSDWTDYEFGTFETNGQWIPSPSPKLRRLSANVGLSGLGGELGPGTNGAVKNALGATKPQSSRMRNCRYLIWEGSVGDTRYQRAESTEDAERIYARNNPIGSGAGLGIAIARDFLGGRTDDGQGTGIVGSALPIRISGQRQIAKKTVGFEVFLTSAESGFTKEKGDPSLVLRLEIGKGKVWFIDLGEKHLIEAVSGFAEISLPDSIGHDGRLNFKLRDAKLGFRTKIGRICIDVALNSLAQEIAHWGDDFLTNTIEIPIELPECIRIDNKKMIAKVACPDGTKRERMSNMFLERNRTFVLKRDGFQSTVVDRNWHLSVPIIQK